jgi:methionyl-tRNA synthetase
VSAEKFYTTTSIPYVNGKPHIGHALEFLQTDIIARFQRQLGRDVHFLTGTDDNSLKNVRAAESEGIPTQALVDRNSQRFLELIRRMEITNDGFIHTASPRHHRGAQKLWSRCKPEDIYKKTYRGLYCVGCERFYTESELVDGKCPDHLVPPEMVEEENYFFRLGNYQATLEELIESDTYRVVPEFRKNEVLSFIRSGLEDFSISRSQARARDWGIPVPGDPGQVMYVWFDALSNYITGIDFGDDGAGTDPANLYTRFWPCDTHVIGKDIIRFHAVYWPAMLLSAGLPAPRELFVHGFINIKGAKIGKSLGNAVDPFELIDKYGIETIRYYLARHIHPFHDSDFTLEGLEEAYTASLANGVGNLVSRSLTMIAKNGGGQIHPRPCDGALEREARGKLLEVVAEYERLMPQYEYQLACNKVWEGVAALDGYINTRAPWKLAKDPAEADALADVLFTLAEGVRVIASLLYPVMPATATEIWRRLGLEKKPNEIPWSRQREWGLLTEGLPVDKGDPLFPRLEPRAETTD